MNFFIIGIATKITILNQTHLDLIINYNYLMIMVNLIPIIPLDGSKIVENILELFFDTEYANDLSFYLSIILIIICAIVFFIFHLWFYLFFVIYLLIKNINVQRSVSVKLRNSAFFYQNIK